MIKLVYLSCLLLIVSIHLASTKTSSSAPSVTVPAPTSTKHESTRSVKAKTCGKNDLKYTYTPCDQNDNRWRVQIPNSPGCVVKHAEAPVLGIRCSFSCKPGEYLDMDHQKCQKCPAGQYSVGDGKRFSSWEVIPEGFISKGFDTSGTVSKSARLISSAPDPKDVCKDAKWKPNGHYLESNGSSCRSLLIYDVNLDRRGNITFVVKSGDESSLFHVWVDNDVTCGQNDHDAEASGKSNKYFQVSNNWRTYNMELAKGHNIVYFVAANFDNNYGGSYMGDSSVFSSDTGRSTLIKEIVVRGFSSSYDCDRCPEGTFSPPGYAYCLPCPENTYSKGGAHMCVECGSDKYSLKRSSFCTKREACTENDYYMVWEPCKDDKTRKTFKWKEPRICSTALKDSVKLPEPTKKIKCPSCNPGQTNNGTECVYCPSDTFSNGNEPCKRCPPSTKEAPGLFYKFWTRYPGEPMHLYCIARPASGCSTTRGWMVHEDYMDTGSGHSDDAELLLVITIPKFTQPKNVLTLDFSIDCQLQACRFKIESMESDSTLHTIRTYEGHQERTTFSHVRHSSGAIRYRLVFEKKYKADQQTYKYAGSRLKIYGLSVTNAKLGGTEKCTKCSAEEGTGNGCITCEPGQYISKVGTIGTCFKCPKNTYSESAEHAVGLKACKKCPEGTVSEPGSTYCHSNCLLTVGKQTYNFTALSGLHMIDGQKRFTTKGYMYYHQFKVTACGAKGTESVCVNNATNMVGKFAKASICRSTIIPDDKMVVSAQSISIGTVLKQIDTRIVKAKEDNSSSISRSQTDEFRFIFHSDRITEVCKNGTYGIIRLICDPYEEDKGKVELGDGNKCHSETCDGCNYTFTVRSKFACPTCVPSDIMVINTACTKGVKRTHYVWKQPHVCLDNGIKPYDTETVCTIFEKSIMDYKVIILAFLLGAILLTCIVLYLCYRNRTLTYNYHRLIDASQAKDGELPAAEMCALEDGEEEEEEILVNRGKGGVKIIDRLRGIGKRKKDFSEFETINLDSIHYTDDDEI